MKQAVVIGSGFGGLSTALLLQSNGYKTIIIEALDKLGGRGRVYEKNGYLFEAGPTVITAPQLIEELYQKSGLDFSKEIDLIETTPFYDLYFADGSKMHYFGEEEKLIQEIKKINEDDVEGYKAFYKQATKIYNKGFVNLVKNPFLSYFDFLKQLPNLIYLRAYRSVYDLVKKYFKDDRLRKAFSFHTLLIGGNPTKTTSIYALIHALEREEGVFYARGGTHAIVDNIAQNFQSKGGEIIFNQSVKEILVQDQEVIGVSLSNGKVISTDIVVSNADITRTYTEMIGKGIKKDYSDKWFKKKFYTPSLFITYFATDIEYDQLSHHSIIFSDRYEEMLEEIYEENNILTEDFSLYLHAPKRSDPSRAPKGKDIFYVLSVVPNLKSNTNWNEVTEQYQQKILKELEDRNILPELSKHIEFATSFTPDDFESVLQSHHGTAFSLQPTLFQSGPFRPHNRSKKIKGLYFAGAGTQPGAGIPGVIASGLSTYDLIKEDFPIEDYFRELSSEFKEIRK